MKLSFTLNTFHAFLRLLWNNLLLIHEEELRKKHLHLTYLSTHYVKNKALEIVNDITKLCDLSQTYVLDTLFSSLSFPDETIFNEHRTTAMLCLDSYTVLDVFDTCTKLPSAKRVSSASIANVWERSFTMWETTYNKYRLHIHIDHYLAFIGIAWTQLFQHATVETSTFHAKSLNLQWQIEM